MRQVRREAGKWEMGEVGEGAGERVGGVGWVYKGIHTLGVVEVCLGSLRRREHGGG